MLKDFTQMTTEQQMNAYAEVKARFALKAVQRTKLDNDPLYEKILFAAHRGTWITVKLLLQDAQII